MRPQVRCLRKIVLHAQEDEIGTELMLVENFGKAYAAFASAAAGSSATRWNMSFV
jgi:hypothetical protein